MLWSTLPAFFISLMMFYFLGLDNSAALDDQRIPQLMHNLESEFFIAWYLLIPLFLTLFLAIRKFPAFPAIGLGALVGGVFAVLFQQDLVMSLADKNLPVISANITVVWRVMFEGLALTTQDPAFNDLLSGGGMGSMLNTIWLIITAMTFGAIMEKVGLLKLIVDRLLALSNKVSSLIISTILTAFGTNCIAADQYISIVIPGRMFKDSYHERGLAPENLSRALEDGGTVTSVLVPWNTCAAYMQSVLLVNPLEYAVYCFFNWLTPLIGIISALIGFKIKTLIVGPASNSKAISEA